MVKESRIDSRTSSSGIARDNYWKRILIVDDESDITTTLKLAIENANETSARRIVVNTYNDPRLVLLDFEPNLYDLLLVDINMPYIDDSSYRKGYWVLISMSKYVSCLQEK